MNSRASSRGFHRWSRRDVRVALLIAAFVVVQIALPVVFLAQRGGMFWTDSDPATGEQPFSWQMYTVVRGPSLADVVFVDGSSARVRLSSVLGTIDERMIYDDDGLSALCEAIAEAREVRVTVAGVRQSHAC